MNKITQDFIAFIQNNNGIANKESLIKKVVDKFRLIKDSSVYYTNFFAVRFCYTSTNSFTNTVLSLSKLQKYDDFPFIICLIKKDVNILYLANTTFLYKISHSSHLFNNNNIRGSFNGSDIIKDFNGIFNKPENFDKLFAFHTEFGFAANLPRLVEATNNISPTGNKFLITNNNKEILLNSIERAISFNNSNEYNELLSDLNNRVEKFKNEIVIASLINNVNIRGRVVEYIIAGDDDALRLEIVKTLKANENLIPRFSTANSLGDYTKEFNDYFTETDIKTKIMILHSNPKAYNIDKILKFLSSEKSIFMFYFIGINPNRIINKILVSMFQKDILNSTMILKHWAGRNSRGVTQLLGNTIHKLIEKPNYNIDKKISIEFINKLIKL